MPGPMEGVRVVEVPAGGATTPLPAAPVDFAGRPCSPSGMAPEASQHTHEVLAELGRDAGAIAALREQGVVA